MEASAEQALSALATGLLKNTTTTGVLSIAVAGTDYAAAIHTHAASDITSGVLSTARLGTGTANSTKYLAGDSTWQTLPSGVTGSARLPRRWRIFVGRRDCRQLGADIRCRIRGISISVAGRNAGAVSG